MPAPSPAEICLFGGFRLDRRIGVPFRRDEHGVFVPLAIGSRALAILAVLVERPGELVSRAEIIAAVWPGMAVEDSNLDVQIAALRRVLDAERTGGSCIQTIRGRGYRFTAPVTPVQAGPISGMPPLPDKPSIAVMPFQNMSGDPEQEYFADGMVEEIITALSRITWLFVIARNSSFTYKGQAVNVKQVGARIRRPLCPRRCGTKSRRPRAHHRATDRCDDRRASLGRPVRRLSRRHIRSAGQIALNVAGVIEPTLEAAETRRSANRPTYDLTALRPLLARAPRLGRI